MATYSGIRMYAPVYRQYKGSNGKVEKIGYMTSTANTVTLFSLENIFKTDSAIFTESTVGKRTNQRAGETTTTAPASTASNDKSFRTLRLPSGKGHKIIRVQTWDQIGDDVGSYHTVGFTIPKIITNIGCQMIMGALLKEKVSLLPPGDVNSSKCRNTFTIDGKKYGMILNLPTEVERYYAGDVIETTAELDTIATASDQIANFAELVTAES